jgi:hypothetical protein
VDQELKPYRLSNSKVKKYRRCPKQFEYSYVMKLQRKTPAIQLKRGDWLHQLLMVHYDGEDWLRRHSELTMKFYTLFEEEREEYGDLPGECQRIFTSYLMNYKQEDESSRTVDSEMNEILVLPNGDEFNFIIDRVVEERDGGLWLWDHKTVKSFMDEDFMLLDAQLARYFWAAEKMGYTPLRGVLFNEIITKPPTLPEFLVPSQRLSMRQNLSCDVFTYYREIKRLGLDPTPYKPFLRKLKAQNKRWFRRTRLPRDVKLTERLMAEMQWTSREMQAAEALKQFPRSPMKSCAWDCDFMDLCQTQLMGGDIRDILKLRYQPKTKREEK